ncbi:LacI family DNA-binding transcriptional regulator [Agrococcus sp. TSP3-2-1]|uniref:LacI family DNA-binding transcriptional regulator n=1 Tax=Agrococcus sp. TSP3-2-1 TaxID=2804583 RepID=UPI003CF63265
MLGTMSRRITSFDVARLAGVSQSTVSRALRDLPSITPATRAKVARAAAELRYVPLESGRSLSTRVTRRIAIVSESLTNPYHPLLIEALRARLADLGYQTVLLADREDDALTVATLADGSYDGVVITTAARTSTLSRTLEEAGVPCIMVNRSTDDVDQLSCTFDNLKGSTLIAELLIELGHTRIALINGPDRYSTSAARERGLRLRLDAAGLWIPERMTRRVPYSTVAGRAAALDLLRLRDRPTAVVCANDDLGLGALNAAASLGLAVPEDLTVIGFDDIPMAAWDVFSMTTIRCDLNLLAARAVELLARLIRGRESAGSQVIDVELVARDTHAPPRVPPRR